MSQSEAAGRHGTQELKAAAERLASALADVDEEQLVSEFKELRRRGKGASR